MCNKQFVSFWIASTERVDMRDVSFVRIKELVQIPYSKVSIRLTQILLEKKFEMKVGSTKPKSENFIL